MKRILSLSAVLILSLSVIPGLLDAAEFYEGKTLRILVGSTPGSSSDLYPRVLSRHMGRHIPGNPTLIVENVPGGGGLVLANQLYNVTKNDGLTIGHFLANALFLNQIFKQPGVECDAQKFIYIGAAIQDKVVCILTKKSGITSLEKWMAAKTPVKLGATALGGISSNTTRLFAATTNLPIKVVIGYKGTPEVGLAMESGELDGVLVNYDTATTTFGKSIKSGDAAIVLQFVPKAIEELPKIPLAINLCKTDEARQLLELGVHDTNLIARPYVLPPGTPKDRVQLLRKAFQETLGDKEFLAEINKAQMDLDPVTGEDLEKTMASLFKRDPSLYKKLQDIYYKQ
jgi:tripartite-type tricarboxylate transporter receptor subunit TctC